MQWKGCDEFGNQIFLRHSISGFIVYLTNHLNGCYIRMLRKARGWTFKDRKTLDQNHGSLPRISKIVERRQTQGTAHKAMMLYSLHSTSHSGRLQPSKSQGAMMTYTSK